MNRERGPGPVWLASWLLLLGLATAGPLTAQRGALTIPRNLAELVSQAQTIVRGRVLLARVEAHPQLKNLRMVVVTLRVEETLKGDPDKLLTYRQLIWDVRDRYDLAGYKKGQRLLLLLNRPTRLGLTSTAGLEQGRFRILSDARGIEYAVNGHGNAGLFRRLVEQLEGQGVELDPELARMVATPSPGPVRLRELESVVRRLARIQ